MFILVSIQSYYKTNFVSIAILIIKLTSKI